MNLRGSNVAWPSARRVDKPSEPGCHGCQDTSEVDDSHTTYTMAAGWPKAEVPCLAVAWQRLPGLNGNPELFRARNITKRLGESGRPMESGVDEVGNRAENILQGAGEKPRGKVVTA